MLSPTLYFHTVRHLRPGQLLARLRHLLPSRPAQIGAITPDAYAREGRWIFPPGRAPSLLGPTRVRFLNRERELRLPADWQGDERRLWLYNLHYFEDLVAQDAPERTDWQRALIAAWIRDNQPTAGVGWEPYPVSVRVVNWIKWSLAGNRLDAAMLASLATQLRHLQHRMEWHLLGNHLFTNAKALVFGGLFFAGREAESWLADGTRLVHQQVCEQVLPDGGHFERSPMYHALFLEDVLDLLNALHAYPNRQFPKRTVLIDVLAHTGRRMLSWLEQMMHPDGQIAFFNDAALGIALSPSPLRSYAAALNVLPCNPVEVSETYASGYVRLEAGTWCAIFDAAPVGPDYQPGHAHADTLAFELSVNSERVITNSGTSTYEKCPQRAFERSTRAHNTVEVDGEDSSEVWAAFRVARRARPFDMQVRTREGLRFVSCAHDGYSRLRGAPVHRRRLDVTPHALFWTDRVEGVGLHEVRGFIPLTPGMEVQVDGPQGKIFTPGGRQLLLSAAGIDVFAITEGTYAPEFGLIERRPVLTWQFAGRLPFEASFELSFLP